MKLNVTVGEVSTIKHGSGFECNVSYSLFTETPKLYATAYGQTKEEAEHNAHFISAGFEMLSALKLFMNLFNESDMRPEDECHEIANAVAKAIDLAMFKGKPF